MNRKLAAVLALAAGLLVTGAAGLVATASAQPSVSPFQAPLKALSDRRKALAPKLQKLQQDVKKAEQQRAQLEVLRLAGAGDPGALKTLKGAGLEEPKAGGTHPCMQVLQTLRRIDGLVGEGASAATEAVSQLNSGAGEPSDATVKATVAAARATQKLDGKADAVDAAIKTLEGQLRAVQGAPTVDMSAVKTWNGRIGGYDTLMGRLQDMANEVDKPLQAFEQDRTAFSATLAAARLAAPGDPIPPMFERTVNDMTLDGSAIEGARKLTWTADNDVAAYRKALDRLSSDRALAASQEADLCAPYGSAGERQALQEQAKAKLGQLRDAVGQLVVALMERANELEDYRQRNATLRSKFEGIRQEALRQGDTAKANQAAEAIKRADERAKRVGSQSTATQQARSGAEASRDKATGAFDLLGAIGEGAAPRSGR